MIDGIGIDVVKVERFRACLAGLGEPFSRFILTPQEHVEFESRGSQPGFIASRFAAKEAFVKALGTGFRDGLTLQTISVLNDAMGKPIMVCNGRAEEIIKERNVAVHLSLSDDEDFAVAAVAISALIKTADQ